MNHIVDNFPEILSFADNYNLPLTKKRAILREYLQAKILSLIYKQKSAVYLYFVGGTALRLLHNLDRFSEDMDFDAAIKIKKNISPLVSDICRQLEKENIKVILYHNITALREYFELRFPHLLSELKISSEREEKLVIKLDFAYFWRGHSREVKLFSRYGFLVNVVSIPLGQMLVQKLCAYLNRRQTLARDLYDITWLSSRVEIDRKFSRENNINKSGLLNKVKAKYLTEKSRLKNLKGMLKPFLIDEDNADRIDLLAGLLK